jgi:hypothetical protein
LFFFSFIILLAPEAANDGNEVNDDKNAHLFVVVVVVESFGRNRPRNKEVLGDDVDADDANGFQFFESSSFASSPFPPPFPPPKVRRPLENVEQCSTTNWGKTSSLLFLPKRGGVSDSLLRIFFLF